MKQEIIANCTPDETRVAVIEDDRLTEIGIERKESEKIVGNIYKGRVENVLPGISSAFVNIGLEKNAYLYISDVVNQSEEEHKNNSHSINRPIDQLIKKGDIMLVQIAKEAIGTKGVKISMDISLPGRFLVYLPYQSTVGISKNIEDEGERKRLKDLIESCRPKHGGFIARPADFRRAQRIIIDRGFIKIPAEIGAGAGRAQ
jgi:ribonuclease G